MTKYHVHNYREMRLVFGNIEADTPEAAAAIARDGLTSDADEIDDCNGEDLSALIDVAGDEEFEHTVTVDFEGERVRKAAPKLLDVLRWITCCPMIRGPVGTTAYIISDEKMAQARTAIAEAEGAGIQPAPASTIEAERLRRAVASLLKALEIAEGVVHWARENGADRSATEAALALIRTSIAEAEADRPPSTHSFIEITEEAFDDHYPLLANHLNPNASWGDVEGGGCLFETYGVELEFVRRQDPRTVWTFVDGDEDDQYVLSGFHAVNRIGYLLSTVPLAEGVEIQVRIPSESQKFQPQTE